MYKGFHAGVETYLAAIDLEDIYNSVQFYFLLCQLQDFNIQPFFVNRSQPEPGGTYKWQLNIRTDKVPLSLPISPIIFSVYTVRFTEEQFDGRRWTLAYEDHMLVYRRQNCSEGAGRVRSHITWSSYSVYMANLGNATVALFSLNNHLASKPIPVVSFCGRHCWKN